MNPGLKRLLGRVDAMTLRERGLLFLCILVVMGAVTWLFFVMPLAAVQKQRVAQIDQITAQMEALRDQTQVGILEGRRQRAEQLKAESAQLQAQLDAVERELGAVAADESRAAGVPALLKRVVRPTDKVSLVRVASSSAGAGAAPPVGGAGGAGSGLDITLSGRYLDLMEYLASLEAAVPLAQWSSLRLTAETVPVQVVVRMVVPPGQP